MKEKWLGNKSANNHKGGQIRISLWPLPPTLRIWNSAEPMTTNKKTPSTMGPI